MEGNYQPTPEEMQKAENMVSVGQRSIDELIARRREISKEIGLADAPKNFSVNVPENALSYDVHHVIGMVSVHGFFDGSEVTIGRRAWNDDTSKTYSKDHNVEYSATFDGEALSDDQAEKLYSKIKPLIYLEIEIQKLLKNSTGRLGEDTRHEIRMEEEAKKRATAEKLERIFGI